MAFFGYPRGHRVCWRFAVPRCEPKKLIDTHPRTERPKNPRAILRKYLEHGRGFLLDAQAACRFSCSGSKRSPFFHTARVIAAIFRARVSRAIVGFLPLASKSV